MSRRSRPHYRSGPEWILGVAFEDTLTRPARLAQGFTSVRCCGAPRASSPHGLAAPALASRDGRDCVQLPPARGCYHLAPRRTFTSNPAPMPGTPSTPPQRHSHPDCRAILTLIVALDRTKPASSILARSSGRPSGPQRLSCHTEKSSRSPSLATHRGCRALISSSRTWLSVEIGPPIAF